MIIVLVVINSAVYLKENILKGNRHNSGIYFQKACQIQIILTL